MRTHDATWSALSALPFLIALPEDNTYKLALSVNHDGLVEFEVVSDVPPRAVVHDDCSCFCRGVVDLVTLCTDDSLTKQPRA